MGWKSTVTISRQEAIELILKRGNSLNELTNDELSDRVGDLYGDDPNLEYYGANFYVSDDGTTD